MDAMTPRPPLPPGPYVVVGLARSGRAAGRALAALGATVAGVDSGAVDAAARADLEAAGVAVHEQTDGLDVLAGAATLVKSPACRRRRRSSAPRASVA